MRPRTHQASILDIPKSIAVYTKCSVRDWWVRAAQERLYSNPRQGVRLFFWLRSYPGVASYLLTPGYEDFTPPGLYGDPAATEHQFNINHLKFPSSHLHRFPVRRRETGVSILTTPMCSGVRLFLWLRSYLGVASFLLTPGYHRNNKAPIDFVELRFV